MNNYIEIMGGGGGGIYLFVQKATLVVDLATSVQLIFLMFFV